MAKKKYDVVAITGTYQDAQGQEKKRYLNCGVVFENEETGNLSIKIETMPVGEWNGWLSLFEPRQQQSGGRQQQSGQRNDDPFA